jgi:hypothetical protein
LFQDVEGSGGCLDGGGVEEGDGVEGFALFVLVAWELGGDELVGIGVGETYEAEHLDGFGYLEWKLLGW